MGPPRAGTRISAQRHASPHTAPAALVDDPARRRVPGGFPPDDTVRDAGLQRDRLAHAVLLASAARREDVPPAGHVPVPEGILVGSSSLCRDSFVVPEPQLIMAFASSY
jgi:hypothetical protein